MPGYQSAGSAFSSGLEERLLRREMQKRQDLLDQHKIRIDDANLKLQQDALDERREDRKRDDEERKTLAKDKVLQAKSNHYDKRAAGKKPGDVMTPDMAQEAIETGNEDDLIDPKQGLKDFAATMPSGPARTGVEAQAVTPPMEEMVENRVPLKFMGSPVQRDAAVKLSAQNKFIDEQPADKQAAYRAKQLDMQPSGTAAPGTQIVQTPDGPILVNKGTGVGEAVKGADGEPLEANITAQTRAMMEGAQQIKPHIARVDLIAQELDKSGKFGIVASRMRDAMAKVGTIDATDFEKSSVQMEALSAAFNEAVNSDPALSTDALVGQFSAELGLLASGVGRVHGGARGGGSIQMINYMKDLMGASGSYEMFHGRMRGIDSYISGYAEPPKRGKKADTTAKPAAAGAAPKNGDKKVMEKGPYAGKEVIRVDGAWEPVNPNEAAAPAGAVADTPPPSALAPLASTPLAPQPIGAPSVTITPGSAPESAPPNAPLRVAGDPARQDRVKTSVAGIKALNQREGFSTEPYQDAGTGLAIGYGMHTWKGKPVTDDLRITKEEADAEMERQVRTVYAPVVDRALKVPVSQEQYDALISVAWNNPSVARTLAEKLNRGEELTEEDFQRSATVKGVKHEGLKGRRGQEFAPFDKRRK